jgi:hypothetical protein
MEMLLENKTAVIYRAGGPIVGAVARTFELSRIPQSERQRFFHQKIRARSRLPRALLLASLHNLTSRPWGETFGVIPSHSERNMQALFLTGGTKRHGCFIT